MLRFESLGKQYGGKIVLAGISHEFGTGCHALRSPNGSGKSTLLKVLAGVELPTSGEVWIAGHSMAREPLEARARLSYVPDTCPVYPFMTGRSFLELVASAKQTRIDETSLALAARLGLTPHLDVRIGQMSLGTQKKMMLAAASVGSPSVILADEPSNAIDDASRQVVIEYFRSVASRATVLFSTHDAEFARACNAHIVGMPASGGQKLLYDAHQPCAATSRVPNSVQPPESSPALPA